MPAWSAASRPSSSRPDPVGARSRPPSGRPCRRSAPCRRRAARPPRGRRSRRPTARPPGRPSRRRGRRRPRSSGLPRESRISRASTSSIDGHGRSRRLLAAAFGRLAARPVQEDGDAGQLAALEELERRAAAGRDVGHLVGEALLRDRGDRVAAADDDRRAGLGRSARNRAIALACRAANDGDLEHAERPVPEHGLGVGASASSMRSERLLAEVDDVPARRDLLGRERSCTPCRG